MIRDLFLYKEPADKYGFDISAEKDKTSDKECFFMAEVSKDIDENLAYARQVLSCPDNGDIVIREFDIEVCGGKLRGFAVFADGLSSGRDISQNILLPLMCLADTHPTDMDDMSDYILRCLIPHIQTFKEKDINKILKSVNYGNCGIFIDTLGWGFSAEVKAWEHRSISEPANETVIQGPHEGFNEMLRANTALIRKTLNTNNLVMKNVTLGRTSKTPAAVCYLKNVANTSLVDEVEYRLTNLDTEYILSSLTLAQYIEEATFVSVPQIITTERPDRVCHALIEGRVAIVVSGSSHVLIVPATLFDMASSPEDSYLRFPYSLLTRCIRIIAIILSLLAPAVFLAVMNFHQELILTDILFALSKARSAVPFSSFIELLLMELSFELIKEASVRVPGPVGSSLGIVGGLILGQAAVSANIVSPIMIIVVAITGISSFAIPSYQLSFSFRFMRFIYTFGAAIAGFVGIFTVMFIDTLLVVNTKSFGTPYTSPIASGEKLRISRLIFTPPVWKKGIRPDYLKPKDKTDSSYISRKWKYKKR
ncbi:MAG: spore germination protein [Ruminococcaceae bacterium]|nr:spore germination protein [Oscillospiraceae bacterium]